MAEQVITQTTARLEEEEDLFVAGQWRLMWWRFRRHKPALLSGAILAFFYLLFPFAEFMGMGEPGKIDTNFNLVRPQALKFFDPEGTFSPHMSGLIKSRDPDTLKRTFEVDPDLRHNVGFFVRGWDYQFLGFITWDRHFFGFTDPTLAEEGIRRSPYLLGSDELGRDQWSRLMLATRISLSIGFVGVIISSILNIIIGAVSGFYSGIVDNIIQRINEIISSIPTLPLWMGLAQAMPQDWGVLQRYLAITIILSVLQGLSGGRGVRSRYLAIREEDFVMAAQLSGATDVRIMFRHILPSIYSYLIAGLSLAVPSMIIGEVALSFLGLGLREPAVSFGVMLQQAQNPATVAIYPWLMFVAIPVILIVLAFNFLGDGLRDAADPYGGT